MITILNLTAVPLDEHLQQTAISWKTQFISIRIGEHEIGRVEDIGFYGGMVDVEETAAGWLRERLTR